MDGDTRSSSLGAPLDNGLYNGPLGAMMKPLISLSKKIIPSSLLLNFDNNLIDLSGNNIPITNTAGSFNTSIVRFGSASIFFSATSQSISTPIRREFGFGSGDFTVDFWAYKLSGSATWQDLFCLNQYASSNPARPYIIFRYTSNADSLYFGTSAYNWNPSVNGPLNRWVYFAITRNNGLVNIYVNGRSVLSFVNTVNFTSDGYITVGTGAHAANEGANAYIDNLRIINGIALDINENMMNRQIGY